MFVQNTNANFTHWTLLKTFESISTHSHETVHCYIVNSILHNMFTIYPYRLFIDSFIRVFRWIPFESQTWKCWVSSSQVGVHRNTILQSFYNLRSWYKFNDNFIFNHSWNDPKSNWSWFDFTVHSEVTWVHKSAICWCEMTIKWH